MGLSCICFYILSSYTSVTLHRSHICGDLSVASVAISVARTGTPTRLSCVVSMPGRSVAYHLNLVTDPRPCGPDACQTSKCQSVTKHAAPNSWLHRRIVGLRPKWRAAALGHSTRTTLLTRLPPRPSTGRIVRLSLRIARITHMTAVNKRTVRAHTRGSKTALTFYLRTRATAFSIFTARAEAVAQRRRQGKQSPRTRRASHGRRPRCRPCHQSRTRRAS